MYQLLFCPFSFFLPFVQKILSIREVALHVIMAPYDFPKNTMLRSPKGRGSLILCTWDVRQIV